MTLCSLSQRTQDQGSPRQTDMKKQGHAARVGEGREYDAQEAEKWVRYLGCSAKVETERTFRDHLVYQLS